MLSSKAETDRVSYKKFYEIPVLHWQFLFVASCRQTIL